MDAREWDQFLGGIGRLGGIIELDEAALRALQEVAKYLEDLEAVTPEALAAFIQQEPDRVPLLALTVRLSQEQVKNNLRHAFGTSSWQKLAKERPVEVISMLDDQFNLVERIAVDRSRQWSYADILAERYASRLKAGGAIIRGRDLEDAVQSIASELSLPHQMRTRFIGRGNESAPCDLAIPSGGSEAEIVIGIKGFDSTGSKLSDAAREIEAMASVRRPNQYVFVVLDGLGWISRQSDLKKIHSLWVSGSIDGVYTTRTLGALRDALSDAATRRGIEREP